uniref:DUF5681 domain-containing protein n=1 Tax=viral metagenome TaxID=1070528 RepID=A0A6M3IHF8_9ZZZZ
MPFKSGNNANPNGRPKGTPNKFTTLKQAWLDAFDTLGGVEGLATWAKDNPTQFYKMFQSMLPRETFITADVAARFKWESDTDADNNDPIQPPPGADEPDSELD